MQSAEGSAVWRTSPLLHRMVLGSLALAVFAFCLSGLSTGVLPVPDISSIYLYREDRWLLLMQSLLLLVACANLNSRERHLRLPPAILPFIVCGLVLLCYAGTKWLLYDYSFSRDEQMAVFDSQIFRSGVLVARLPPLWQEHATALNTLFMLPVLHPVAWVSAYLPMNAMLRTAVGFAADPDFTAPLMVALGLVSLWKCARLLWPDDPEAAIVAILLYLGSGQVLFAGMTAYAMPAYLALDMLWLWCFLLNRRAADIGALLVAFVATGLHQPLFHPLFAAPILFTLVSERNWRRLALYAIGYGAICSFWLAWPVWMHTLVAGPHSITAAAGTDFVSRLVQTVSQVRPHQWQQTAANLVRFFAWQHLLLLPLMACAVVALRRYGLAAAFAVTTILPVGVMMVLLPFQGNGFGYRYLHGVIGAAILLAVYGWRSLVAEHSWLRPLILRTTMAGIVVLLPLQAWMAWRLYAPFARIDQRVAASGADYFVIGTADASLAFNLVGNRPDLSNRPIRLLGDEVDDALIGKICRPGVRVLMPTSDALRPIENWFLNPHSTAADARIAGLSPRLNAAGCTVDRLGAAP